METISAAIPAALRVGHRGWHADSVVNPVTLIQQLISVSKVRARALAASHLSQSCTKFATLSITLNVMLLLEHHYFVS